MRVLKARQLDVCDAIGDFIEYWGFKRIHGRVWALVALSSKPLPQVEIAQKLGVSRSLVSGVVAELVDRGLLRPTEDKRNTPYTAMTDFWPTVAAVLRSREWLLLEKVKIALEGFLVEFERMPIEIRAGFNATRVRDLARMTETAQSFLRLVIGFPSTAGSERVSAWVGHVGSLLKRFAR